jgi:hypothetical protein
MRKYLILTALLGLMTTFAAEACKGDRHSKRESGGLGMHFFNQMDLDNDNKISLAEHNSFHSEKFAEIDTDKNSEISLEEMNNFKKSMKDKWKTNKPD